MTAGRGGARVAAMSNSQSTSAGPPTGTAASRERQHRLYVVDGHAIESGKIDPGLHIVATPIGNLGDITLRALATLAGADLIACEDTRVTRKLLDRYGIATPLTPYHDHNAAIARPKLLQRLAGGAAIALVSDAGTPLVSDPGFKLVRAAQEAGHSVTALPGASAALAALTVAGLPTDQFFFAGFLPPKAGGTPRPHCRTGSHPGDVGVLRNRTEACGYACRPCRRIRQPRSGCMPRAHQTPRGNPPRRSPGAGASRCNGRNSRRIRLVVVPPRVASSPTQTMPMCCCAKRWRGFRSRMR